MATTSTSAEAAQPTAYPIACDDDVVQFRHRVRAAAVQAGLRLIDQTKLVTAASELARNTRVHGGSGSAVVETVERAGRRGVRAEFVDAGPGIPDLDLAMTPGWTSGGGLGLGLSGAKRLVDEFDIDTEVGRGTSITVVKWAR